MADSRNVSSNDLLMLDYQGPTACILDLPDELIEHILLSSDKLQVETVVAISGTCNRLNRVMHRSAAVWKTLFSTYFAEISHNIEKYVERLAADGDDGLHTLWQTLFMLRFNAGRIVQRQIDRMSSLFFHRQDLSNEEMEHFLQLISSFDEGTPANEVLDAGSRTKIGRLFLIDALQSIVSTFNGDHNLTARYYAGKVLRFVRCQDLTEKWIELKVKPVNEQSFYDGLVFIAQWFQPLETIHRSHVIADVESIAIDSLKTLADRVPDHPIFQRRKDTSLPVLKGGQLTKCLFDRDIALQDNMYHGKAGIQILDALNETMFEDKGFRGNSANYYNPANSFIDKVLIRRQGIPITLCILYHLVASRLGLLCKPVNAPRHFLLQWTNTDSTMKEQEVTYIDVFNRGTRMTAAEVRAQDDGLNEHNGRDNLNVSLATPIEVFQRMTRNLTTCAQIQQQETLNLHVTVFPLLKTALELTSIIGRPDEYPGFGLCQIYLQMNVNHREILKELNNWMNWPQNLWLAGDNEHLQSQIESLRRLCLSQMSENDRERDQLIQREPSYRSDFADTYPNNQDQSEMGMFSVGMIMRHKKYNYDCVIYGWDTMCKASKSWIIQMGVDRLNRKDKQPFYNVLVDDGSVRYAADENLEPIRPRRVNHPLIGKYFREYHETFGYEPNDELTRLYPQDFQHLISSKKSF